MTQTQWRCHQIKKKVEKESFATKCEAPATKYDMALSNTQRKPYTRKLSDKDKNIVNQILSLRVAHLGKDGPRERERTLKYTP